MDVSLTHPSSAVTPGPLFFDISRRQLVQNFFRAIRSKILVLGAFNAFTRSPYDSSLLFGIVRVTVAAST